MTIVATFALALAPLQTVHVVDADLGGDFQFLWNAIDVAQDGDTILLRPPGDPNHVFTGGTIRGKSLTIEPEPGYAPRVLPNNPALWQPVLVDRLEIEDLSAGQVVTLRSVALVRDSSGSPDFFGVKGIDCAGAIRIEDCYVSDSDFYLFGMSPSTPLGALWLDRARDVSVTRTTIRSDYQHGVRMRDSRLAVYRSTLQGGSPNPVYADPFSEGAPGHSGVRCEGRSFLWLGGSRVVGGVGGYSACSAYVACTGVGGRGGVAATIDPASLCFLLDTQLEPGDGGVWCEESNPTGPQFGCNQFVYGPPGQPLEGPAVVVPGGQRSLEAPDSWTAGADVPITVSGEPGECVFVTAGTGAGLRFLGPLRGVLLINSGLLTASLDVGVIPASGILTASIPSPQAPAGEAVTLHIQVVARTSPTRWRLSNPTSTLLR